MFVRLDGIPEPPAGYVPPLGASRSTWTNIYKNKGRIDYCVQQFEVCFFSHILVLHLLTRLSQHLSNRLKCIDKLTGGPFLE
mmetsp:Transcript_62079/g.166591  ORF Transcript_62079/g.166591 Transcript_62079/m.166591 type:complete len:82 (-) Transcript_62079:155-400(-)